MPENDIKIRVTLDSSGALKGFNVLNKEIKKTTDEVKDVDTGFSKFQATMVTVSSAMNIAGQVFNVVNQAAQKLFQSLDQAYVVENLSRGLENLQKSVGADATQSLNDLRDATQGLVSDMDLMKQANNAVLLGVDDGTGKFDDLAAAALKLGSVMGITATQSLESLTIGIGRQSRLVLDNLGVIVKAEEAYKSYAAQLGKTVDALTDVEKKQAFNAAATESITEKAAKLAEIEITASGAFQQLKAAVENQTNEFVKSLSANEDLAESFQHLTEVVTSPEFTDGLVTIADGLATIVSWGIELGIQLPEALKSTIPFLDQIITSVQQLNQLLESEAEASFFEDYSVAIDGVNKSLDIIYNKIEKGSKESVGAATADLVDLKILIGEVFGEDSKRALDFYSEDIKELELAIAKANKEFKKTDDAAEDARKQFDKLQKSTTDLVKQYVDKLIPADEELVKQINDINEALDNGEIDQKQYTEAMLDLGLATVKSEEDLAKLKKALEGVAEQKDPVVSAIEDIGKSLGIEGLGDTFKSLDQFGFFDSLMETLKLALEGGTSDVSAILTDRGLEIEVSEAGEQLGASVANLLTDGIAAGLTAAGMPELAMVVDILGDTFADDLGSTIQKAFGWGSTDAGTNIRKGIESWVKDTIDEVSKGRGLELNIGGQLFDVGEIFGVGDLPEWFENLIGEEAVKQYNETGLAYNSMMDLFDTSTERGLTAFEGFEGAGQALNAIFGDLEIGADQLSNILVSNLGFSLNNLQLYIEGLGLSAEDMETALEEAFLAGDIGASDFLSSLDQVNNIMAQGIPDGIGRTDLAMDNLINSLGNGRLAFDALGDLAVEAGEAGAVSMEDLQTQLIAAGYDAEQVAMLMESIGQAGLDSLEELADISVNQTAQVVSSMESMGFAFNDAAESIDDIRQALNDIESDKYVTIHVNTDFQDQASEDIYNGDLGAIGEG